MRTYQVRIATDSGIQEYVERVLAYDLDDAEEKAIDRISFMDNVGEHEHIRYIATSLAKIGDQLP